MQGAWAEVFAESLSGIEPSLIRELAFAHETWANRQSFTDEAAYQTLDRVQRLLAAIAAPTIGELERLKLECLESEEPAVAPAAPPPSPVIRLARPAGAATAGAGPGYGASIGTSGHGPGLRRSLPGRPAPGPAGVFRPARSG